MTTSNITDDWTIPSTLETTSVVEPMDVDPPTAGSAFDVLKLSVNPKYDSIGIKSATTWTSACVSIETSDMPEEMNDRTSALDVVVALDISGSMSGQKLKDCKSTLEAMLRPLGSKDRFGLIVFGSRVRVIIPATLMNKQNKESALKQIKEINTEGMTNLSGGLTVAWKELLFIGNPNSVRSLFLLTDGLANEGIQETNTLVQMVKRLTADSAEDVETALLEGLRMSSNRAAQLVDSATLGLTPENVQAPVSLFCFGYGPDHNSDMLQALAEATAGGGYYFVENDSDVYTAFGDAMGGIMSVMAQSAVLKISVPPEAAANGVKIRDVHHDKKINRGDGTFTVNLGDFYAEENRDVIVDFDLSNVASDVPVPHCVASLSYMDVLSKKPAQAGPLNCNVARPDSNEISTINKYVESQWMRVWVAQELEEADKEARSNQRAQAKIRLEKMAAAIKASEAYDKDDETFSKLELNLRHAMQDYEEATYSGHRSKNMYGSMKTQRAYASREAGAEACYQTKYKARMCKAFKKS
eukprot:CAMPEP_0113619468 /NCGR_PEP_ID=MMETSP0017_2-20120614/9886_1 /TAXON_ID=2856 /ORGANISM="Cylindrotheca closterium" /LENGTH=526 /DNA_ID=CAMNT_0000529045 /DNA_START=85 /DNA_END=1665 /DNA_ORIENTATION=+ /assembly_acc=CAM_ASM_000147